LTSVNCCRAGLWQVVRVGASVVEERKGVGHFYYPDHVGAVGGLVGMIGGLGGFVLPIAFGAMNDLTDIWTSCFMLLFALVGTALAWMHFAIRRMERARLPELETLPELPEMVECHPPARSGGTRAAIRPGAAPLGQRQRAN
jgi:hypothetical protein